jgi:hypothetical protein
MMSPEREFWRGASCTIWVGYDTAGALRFIGYDRVHLDGYEYTITVQRTQFPALRQALGAAPDVDVLDAVCARVDDIMATDERSWLRAHGIPCDLQTW